MYCSSCESFVQVITQATCNCKQSTVNIIQDKIHITGAQCFIIAIDSTELCATILDAEYDRIARIKRKAGYPLDSVIMGPDNEAIYKSTYHGKAV